MSRIRLMIVDDSLFTRKMLQQMVESDPRVEVVALANNGEEAVEKAHQFKPDIITLDVIMPVMDGIAALKQIMRECPTQVLMVSGVTTEGAEVTLDALALGAADFLPKPTGGNPAELGKLGKELLEKIHAIAGRRRQPLPAPIPAPAPTSAPETKHAAAPAHPAAPPKTRLAGKKEIVLIGTSTGGPNALQVVIPRLPADLPVGVLIVQHMPATFTQPLAARLDRISAVKVKEAQEGDEILPGQVLLAPGHSHLVLRERGRVGLDQEPANVPHRPAVDVLMASAAKVYGGSALGVIMTGMGQDGKEGMTQLKAKGGTIIAQDERTCVVYGMPRAVVEAGLADAICPLEEIAATIIHHLK
jgi:two-component system chemotaxis response regulator CheB